MIHQDITNEIIAAAIKVHRHLGNGFLEKCYENAMVIECKRNGLNVSAQVPLKVEYYGHIIGEFFADLLINGEVIVELKAVNQILPVHQAQTLNYLKATGKKVGLILNFGKNKVEIKRMIR